MSLGSVAAAVEARLTANWTRCPVRGLNEADGDTPAAGGPFLVVQYPIATSAQITIGAPGANTFRDEGAIRFVLSVRRGKGLTEPMQWLDELRTLFRAKQFDGVRTYAPSPGTIDDGNEEGGYFRLTFAVPFDHDFIG